MSKSKKKMTAAEKAAARVPQPAPVPAGAKPKRERVAIAKEDRRRRFWLMIGSIVAVVVIGAAIYVGNFSHADDVARAALAPDAQVAVDDEPGWTAFGDPDAQVGYVFYPGGKVEPAAYAPLARALAEEGVFCVVTKPLFNLAFLDTDAASDVMAAFPREKAWYVGGHSLGGVAACQWAADNAGSVRGVILLASYPAVDLSQSGLRMLQVYGSEDGVMNRDNLAEAQALQPADTTVKVIEGGNHAQFGSYGEQSGDGKATISAEEQRVQAVADIVSWLDAAA